MIVALIIKKIRLSTNTGIAIFKIILGSLSYTIVGNILIFGMSKRSMNIILIDCDCRNSAVEDSKYALLISIAKFAYRVFLNKNTAPTIN